MENGSSIDERKHRLKRLIILFPLLSLLFIRMKKKVQLEKQQFAVKSVARKKSRLIVCVYIHCTLRIIKLCNKKTTV